jgi:hypothetical protein
LSILEVRSLVRRTGHSRQHAQSMMMMVAMVERIKHLIKASRDQRRLSTGGRCDRCASVINPHPSVIIRYRAGSAVSQ